MTTETQSPDPAQSLSDEQIAELLPEADGTAEHNKVAHPGGGYEYDEVPAWSFKLVAQAVRAALAIPAPEGAHAQAIKERDAYASELARCRDAFQIPEPGSPLEQPWSKAIGDPLCVADYVAAALADARAPAQHPTQGTERVPLTCSQVHDLCNECYLDWHLGWSIDEEPNRYLQLARAIERAHGISASGGEVQK